MRLDAVRFCFGLGRDARERCGLRQYANSIHASKTQLWIDSQPMPQVDLSATTPGSCKTVQGPKLFNKLVVGWDVYTSPSEFAQEAWIDDVVVGAERVGCPAL